MGDCACHADDLNLRWNGDGLAFVFLELTPACDNRCVGCSNVFAAQRTDAPLSGQTWSRLIERILPHVGWLKLTGGEPTLHPDFEAIVEFLAQRGVPFRLLTNGRWPPEAQMVAFLRNVPVLESLLISLHGSTALDHERFTCVPGSFAEAVRAIRCVAGAGLKVATSTVITRYNWNRVDEMVTFAQSLGADHAVFNRYIGPPLPVLEATPAQVAQAVQRVEALIAAGKAVRWGTPVPLCALSRADGGCLAGEAFVTVDPWGNVRPCNHAPYAIGSLLAQPWEKIWRSGKMETWRMMVPDECAGCGLYQSCRGGCRAEAMLRPTPSYPLPRKPYRVTIPRKTETPRARVAV